MMQLILLTLILSSITGSALALELKTDWTAKFQKEVTLSCSESESYRCEEICNNKKECHFKEKTCRDCIGTTTLMTFIFREMGRNYTSNHIEVDWTHVVETLEHGKFATLTSKSIYNQIDRFDSRSLREKFQSLCPTLVEYPVAFFNVEASSGRISTPDFVVCGSNVYSLELNPEVTVEKSINLF
jgi:hypothetical protein